MSVAENRAASPGINLLPNSILEKICDQLDTLGKDARNFCLSSPIVDRALESSKLRFIGEPAFSVLVEGLYLKKDDLLNCAKVSEDFGMFAARNWKMLENQPQVYTLVDLAKLRKLYDFLTCPNTDRKTNWERFIGKAFCFNPKSDMSEESYRKYSNMMDLFFKRFSRYLLYVELNSSYDPENFTRTVEHHSELLVPTVQFMDTRSNDYRNIMRTELNPRTRESISIWEPQNNTQEGIEKFARNENRLAEKLVSQFAIVEGMPNLKYLELNAEKLLTPLPTPKFPDAMAQIEKLTINGKQTICLLASLVPVYGLSGVKEITLEGYDEESWQTMHFSPEFVMPGVRRLNIVYCGNYLPLHKIAHVFPNLRHLQMNFNKTLSQLFNSLNNSIREGDNENQDLSPIDVYKLLAKAHSLHYSNIWQRMHRLREFEVVHLHGQNLRLTLPQVCFWYNSNLVERYYRLGADDSVKLEQIVRSKRLHHYVWLSGKWED